MIANAITSMLANVICNRLKLFSFLGRKVNLVESSADEVEQLKADMAEMKEILRTLHRGSSQLGLLALINVNGYWLLLI